MTLQRREFITLLGGAAWPVSVHAQQSALPIIGYLSSARPEGLVKNMAAFRQGLNEVGYVEGRNVAIEYRWADGQYDRLAAMASDLVGRRVAVITANSPAALAAKAVTTTIPIVFFTASDPVELGLVASLNRPGGNVTGATMLTVEAGPKKLELLRELLPTATIIGFLVNPADPSAEIQSRNMQAAARAIGIQLHVLRASTEGELERVFAALVQVQAHALVIGADGFFYSHSEQLAALTRRHAVPTVFQNREFVAAGGLMSYGGNSTEGYRLMGVYTGRILKGEKPADLPVQEAVKIELFVNLKTAKALGLEVPRTLLARADEVIE